MMNSTVKEFLMGSPQYKIVCQNISLNKEYSNLNTVTFSKIISIIKQFILFIYYIIKFRPHVVYISAIPAGLGFFRDSIFVILAKWVTPRVLLHFHGVGLSRRKSRIAKWYTETVLGGTELIFLSDQIKKLELSSKLQKGIKYTHVLPNGIKELSTPKINFLNKKLNLLFFSNLFKFKGVYAALDIFQKLVEFEPDLRLQIVGNDGDVSSSELQEHCSRNGIQNVKFVGGVKGKEKVQVFKTSDILIYPTENDALPLVLIEALSVGLPVVAYDVGGIAEVLGEGAGFSVEKGNIGEFVQIVRSLVNDDELRRRLSENGRKRYLEHFTQNNFLEKFKKIIDRVE